jgi:hypothetical protein
MYIHISICNFSFFYVHTYSHIQIHEYIHIYTHISIYTLTTAGFLINPQHFTIKIMYIHICVYIYIYIHMYIHISICNFSFFYVHTYSHIQIHKYIHIYTHISIYTLTTAGFLINPQHFTIMAPSKPNSSLSGSKLTLMLLFRSLSVF